jgi:hypothetical protein
MTQKQSDIKEKTEKLFLEDRQLIVIIVSTWMKHRK